MKINAKLGMHFHRRNIRTMNYGRTNITYGNTYFSVNMGNGTDKQKQTTTKDYLPFGLGNRA